MTLLTPKENAEYSIVKRGHNPSMKRQSGECATLLAEALLNMCESLKDKWYACEEREEEMEGQGMSVVFTELHAKPFSG